MIRKRRTATFIQHFHPGRLEFHLAILVIHSFKIHSNNNNRSLTMSSWPSLRILKSVFGWELETNLWGTPWTLFFLSFALGLGIVKLLTILMIHQIALTIWRQKKMLMQKSPPQGFTVTVFRFRCYSSTAAQFRRTVYATAWLRLVQS